MSIHWTILRSLLSAPFRIAVTDDQRSYRAIDLVIAALNVAAKIRATTASSTVGVLIPTGGVFPIAALGAWIAGKTVVPMNYLLKKDELQYVIDDCETDTILTVGPLLDYLGFRPSVKNLVRMEDIGLSGVPDPAWPSRAQPDDLALLLYTSGTSGRPKGVMLTHANISANIRQIRSWVDFTPKDLILGVLPQFHSFGLTVLTLLPLCGGIPVVFTARFVPHRIIKLFRQHHPTIFIAIPSMYNALLHVKDGTATDFAGARYIVSGGEPLPDAVFTNFRERFGVAINEGYGLTETAPVTNWCRPEEWRRHSVGRPLPEVECRIVDIVTRQELGPNQDGEVIVRGPNVMPGYFKLPEQTAAVFDERGFFKTGDIGRLDDDGHLFITGRLKEMLIVGGENVFPREIEEVLNRHPAVADSGVVGEIDPVRGELPVAFVELKEGAAFDERALISWCRESLAGYKAPSRIVRLDALPRNPTGKIMRRELKKMLAPVASTR